MWVWRFFFFFDVRLRITAAVLLDLKRRLNQILSGQLSLQAFAIWTLCPSSQWTHNEIVCVPNWGAKLVEVCGRDQNHVSHIIQSVQDLKNADWDQKCFYVGFFFCTIAEWQNFCSTRSLEGYFVRRREIFALLSGWLVHPDQLMSEKCNSGVFLVNVHIMWFTSLIREPHLPRTDQYQCTPPVRQHAPRVTSGSVRSENAEMESWNWPIEMKSVVHHRYLKFCFWGKDEC